MNQLGAHHPLSLVIQLGIRHPRKKERKKEKKKERKKERMQERKKYPLSAFNTNSTLSTGPPLGAHHSLSRLLGSLKLQVSFAEYRLFYRAFLQKRPIFLRNLIIVALPQQLRNCSLN